MTSPVAGRSFLLVATSTFGLACAVAQPGDLSASPTGTLEGGHLDLPNPSFALWASIAAPVGVHGGAFLMITDREVGCPILDIWGPRAPQELEGVQGLGFDLGYAEPEALEGEVHWQGVYVDGTVMADDGTVRRLEVSTFEDGTVEPLESEDTWLLIEEGEGIRAEFQTPFWEGEVEPVDCGAWLTVEPAR